MKIIDCGLCRKKVILVSKMKDIDLRFLARATICQKQWFYIARRCGVK